MDSVIPQKVISLMTKKQLAKFRRRERDDDFGNVHKPFVENELLFFLKDR